MKLNDGTCIIDSIKWNNNVQLEINDLIDIALIEIIMKNINKIQLNMD